MMSKWTALLAFGATMTKLHIGHLIHNELHSQEVSVADINSCINFIPNLWAPTRTLSYSGLQACWHSAHLLKSLLNLTSNSLKEKKDNMVNVCIWVSYVKKDWRICFDVSLQPLTSRLFYHYEIVPIQKGEQFFASALTFHYLCKLVWK